jgi:SAM-dependent methyltransferase
MLIARAASSLRLRAADAADALLRRRDELTPPRRLADYIGDSDFRATGDEFLRHFRELAQLHPEDRVLDVGCGIGRMARVLVPILRPPGSYDGFDIVLPGISWCREHYRATPAPFRFQHADVRNTLYNPAGRESAHDYRFPYREGSFDLVIATSVFTHLLAPSADHYLAQVARVLAPGGRLFCTWFLLSGDQRKAPPPPFGFQDVALPAAIADPATPEAAVAYDEGWLREHLSSHGLALRAIHHGSWSGRAGSSRQDIVIAYRD